jgi:hypothetical protein
MKKFAAQPHSSAELPDLELPVMREPFPARRPLTLEEYDRLNELGRNFNAPSRQARIESAIREEFVIIPD